MKPGCCGSFDAQGLRQWTDWSLKDGVCADSFEACAEKTRFLLEDSIRRQLVSDVPIGTFLSGGLDSSIVSAVAAQELGAIDTFSVDYRDNEKYFQSTKFQPNSDPYFMDLMSRHIGSHSHRIVLDTDMLVPALLEAAEARDLPGMADVDSSLLLLCRETKKDVTVVLSGECADEIFGGYPWHRDPEVRAVNGFPWAQTTDYRSTFLRPELLAWQDPHEFVDARYRETLATVDKCPGLSPLQSRMKEMMVLNLKRCV